MWYNIFSSEDTPLLKIDNIGTSDDPCINRFGPGQRNSYIIHYVVSGKGIFNGHLLHSGQGFLIKPNTYEHYYPEKDDPWENVWITSHDENMKYIFDLYNADHATQIFEYHSAPYIKSIIPLLKKSNDRYVTDSEILSMFLRMLNSHRQTINDENDYFKYAENYILTHIHMPISVKDLTKTIGISQQYLYKVFMKSCSMSPKKFISTAKLNEAIRLITNTNLSVSQIANSVGYNDILAFSRFFKKEFGISPTKYRVKLKQVF